MGDLWPTAPVRDADVAVDVPSERGWTSAETDPEYARGFASLQSKVIHWRQAAAEKRPLPVLPPQEVAYWQGWLKCADANRMQPRPEPEMRNYLNWQASAATETKLSTPPPSAKPSKSIESPATCAPGNHRCVIGMLVALVILLAAGCVAAAYFAVNATSATAQAEAELAVLKAKQQTASDAPPTESDNSKAHVDTGVPMVPAAITPLCNSTTTGDLELVQRVTTLEGELVGVQQEAQSALSECEAFLNVANQRVINAENAALEATECNATSAANVAPSILAPLERKVLVYEVFAGSCDSTTLCFMRSLGDGTCDATCNNLACGYDGGDCNVPGTGVPLDIVLCKEGGCPTSWLNDGMCDNICNNVACGGDLGDC
eukprot:jgi/Tetstr1/441706/TSEL_029929.t1